MLSLNYNSVYEIKHYLKERGIALTKRHGQNFLLDKNILEKLITLLKSLEGERLEEKEEKEEKKEEKILEIGGGLGHLTEELLANKFKVTVFEIDKKLSECLKERFAGQERVKVIHHDFLKVSLSEYVGDAKSISIVGNIPYNITTPIITKCFDAFISNCSTYSIGCLLFLVQKDVAHRIVSGAGCKEYGSLSVFCQAYCCPRILFNVSKDVFYPKPKIESCAIFFDFRNSNEKRGQIKDKKMFERLLKISFSKRRKTLYNCLKTSDLRYSNYELAKILEEAQIGLKVRAEELGYKKFVELSNKLSILYSK